MRIVDYAVTTPDNTDAEWTPEAIDAAARLWNERRMTSSGIAQAMGRSRSAVCGMISRNRAKFAERGDGVAPANQWTKAMLDTASKLYRLGVAPRAIAAEIGVSLQRLTRVIDSRRDYFPKRTDDETLPDLNALAAAESRAVAARIRKRDREYAVRRQLAERTARAVDYEPGLADLITVPETGGAGPCGLMELTARRCKWPVSGHGAGLLFCGEAIGLGDVYCGCHRRASVEPVSSHGKG